MICEQCNDIMQYGIYEFDIVCFSNVISIHSNSWKCPRCSQFVLTLETNEKINDIKEELYLIYEFF
jgi:hypothetical protein